MRHCKEVWRRWGTRGYRVRIDCASRTATPSNIEHTRRGGPVTRAVRCRGGLTRCLDRAQLPGRGRPGFVSRRGIVFRCARPDCLLYFVAGGHSSCPTKRNGALGTSVSRHAFWPDDNRLGRQNGHRDTAQCFSRMHVVRLHSGHLPGVCLKQIEDTPYPQSTPNRRKRGKKSFPRFSF